MGAAAELPRPAAEVDYPHQLPVLLSEERHRPRRLGLGDRHLLHVADEIVANSGVDAPLDALSLLGGQPAGEAEVEGGVIGPDERATLHHGLPEGLAERPVEQVGGAVVPGDGGAALRVDLGGDRLVPVQGAGLHPGPVNPSPNRAVHQLEAVEHAGAAALPAQGAGVADLAAGLGVEGGDVEEDDVLLPHRQGLPVGGDADASDHRVGSQRFVADEVGGEPEGRGGTIADRREGILGGHLPTTARPAGAAALALGLQGRVEAGPVHREPAFPCHLDG